MCITSVGNRRGNGGGGNSGGNNYMQENRLTPMCRSSPSVFAATYRESKSSPSMGRHRTRNVSTQTDLPINVPVAVLEAFVLAHRSRVLQLLGVQDTAGHAQESPNVTQQPPTGSSQPVSEPCASDADGTSTSSSENVSSSSESDESSSVTRSSPEQNSIHNQKPSISIQPVTAVGGDTRNSNNNRTPNAPTPPLEMYQLTNLQNWNPIPHLNRSFITTSRSTGSLKDILSNNVKNQTRQTSSKQSGACPALVHNQVPKSETDGNKTLVHYGCASNCPKTDLICFSEVNHTMTRSTSMPVTSFKYQPNPSSSVSPSPSHSTRAMAAPVPQSPTGIMPQGTTRNTENKKHTYVTDF